jgi:hypothetical protein
MTKKVAGEKTHAGIEVTTTKSGRNIYLAASGIERKEEDTRVGAYRGLETADSNRFRMLQQLTLTTPHVFIPLLKLSLGLVKNIRFETAEDGKKKELKKNFEDWAKLTNFHAQIQTVSRLTVRDGTFCAVPMNKKDPDKLSIAPLLMERTTLIPAGFKVGSTDTTVILQPPIEKVVVDENNTTATGTNISPKQQVFDFKNIIYGSFCPWDYVIKDRLNRETYGMYGISLLEPIRDPVLKYLDLVEGYTKYIKKYGVGRYHINYTALEDLIKDGEVDAALDAIEKLSNAHKNIKENEDIVGVGFEVKGLDTGGSNLNVVQFKQSLEKDIQIGLLQQPLTMGQAEGTTFAAGYVSETDRMVALEGMQMLIQSIINLGVIDYRLKLMGEKPGSVWVEFEELSRADIAFKDFLALADRDGCTQEEARVRAGLPAKKPAGTALKPISVAGPFGNKPTEEKPIKKPEKKTSTQPE